MDEILTYRLMNQEDIPEVCELIGRVFDAFVAPEYSVEGVQEFYRYIQSGAFQERLQNNHFGLIAIAQKPVVGMLEMRNCSHLSLMFVAVEFQGQGIAKELLRQSLQICQAQVQGLSEISVHSSPYAVPLYERMGFHPTGKMQVRNGIGFIPMVLELAHQDGG
jgi:GNAT superfamily N-acetyltransferase